MSHLMLEICQNHSVFAITLLATLCLLIRYEVYRRDMVFCPKCTTNCMSPNRTRKLSRSPSKYQEGTDVVLGITMIDFRPVGKRKLPKEFLVTKQKRDRQRKHGKVAFAVRDLTQYMNIYRTHRIEKLGLILRDSHCRANALHSLCLSRAITR